MDDSRQSCFLELRPMELLGNSVKMSLADQSKLMLQEAHVFTSDRHGFFMLCIEFCKSDVPVFGRS